MFHGRVTAPLLLAALLAACTAVPADDADAYDPYEGFNRGIHGFNMDVDEYALEPASRGWAAITSEGVRLAFDRFFQNLRFPVHLVNNVLQGKFVDGAEVTGRFVVNTTVGLLGFFDPATGWGLQAHPEDFRQTLGVWGAGPDPYLVLPFIGPSSPRDFAGFVGDVLLPGFWALPPAIVLDLVNDRALDAQRIADARESSVDFYAFLRNFYRQRVDAMIRDSTAIEEEDEEDLYFLDIEE